MEKRELKKELVELLVATGQTHHKAFIETDGVDPDWAVWYGDFLKKKFDELFDSNLESCEIAAELIDLDTEFNIKPRTKHWTEFYADELIGKHTS